MAAALSRLLTEKHIRKLAGEKSFARGQAYHADGHVDDLVLHGDSPSAKVTGGDTYVVHLGTEDGVLSHRCTCPIGADGVFCKHGAALALAFLAETPVASRSSPSADSIIRLDNLRLWLLSQSSSTLADLLLDTPPATNACAKNSSATPPTPRPRQDAPRRPLLAAGSHIPKTHRAGSPCPPAKYGQFPIANFRPRTHCSTHLFPLPTNHSQMPSSYEQFFKAATRAENITTRHIDSSKAMVVRRNKISLSSYKPQPHYSVTQLGKVFTC